MAGFARGALLVLVALSSVGALLFLVPWLKEGHGIEELPLFAGVAAGLAVLAGLWAYFTRRTPIYCASGLALLLTPFLAYVFLSGRLVWNEAQGRRLARTVRVLRLAEREIRWPGFEGPVGLRLEIDLEHAIDRHGTLFSPKVLMGGARPVDGRAYFFGVFDDWARGFLAVPHFADAPADGELGLRRAGRRLRGLELKTHGGPQTGEPPPGTARGVAGPPATARAGRTSESRVPAVRHAAGGRSLLLPTLRRGALFSSPSAGA